MPSDYHLFLHLKQHLSGNSYNDDDDVKMPMNSGYRSRRQVFMKRTPNENSLNLLKDVERVMGQELVEAQVSAVHRIQTYKADRTPSIVVQFTGRMQRDAWITAFKKKKTLTASEINPIFPKQQAVYVNKHQSPENKQLLGQLKKKCSEKNVKFVWVKEGKFFVRKKEGEKCHKVNNIEDIEILFK
ncbi:hypothetical protein J6590_026155 [Homalodisca vitripennis]|nr:hypothetical protein J6590_026155 [Homalodisca vitripennis]